MTYKVLIRPIATDIVISKSSFATEQDAWAWTEAHNCPAVDYDVLPDNSADESGTETD